MLRKLTRYLSGKLITFSIQYPYFALGLLIVVSLSFSPFLYRLSLDPSFVIIGGEDMQTVKQINALQSEIGRPKVFILTISNKQSTGEVLFKDVQKIRDGLVLITGVKHAFLSREKDFYYKNYLLYLSPSALDQIHKSFEGYIKKLGSEDNNGLDFLDSLIEKMNITKDKKYYYDSESNTYGLLVEPSERTYSITEGQILLASITSALAALRAKSQIDSNTIVEIHGSYKNTIDNYINFKNFVLKFYLLFIFVLLAALIIFFRGLKIPIVVFIISMCAPIFVLSLQAFLEYKLSVYSFLGPFFVATYSVLTSIIIILYYNTLKDASLDSFLVSASYALKQAAKPIFLSTLFIAFAFFSLTVFRIEDLSKLGVLVGLGVLFSFFINYIGLTSIIVILGIKNITFGWDITKFIFYERIKAGNKFIWGLLLALLLLTIIGGIVGLYKNEFDYSLGKIIFLEQKQQEYKELFAQLFSKNFEPSIVVSETQDELTRLNEYFLKLGEKSVVGKFVSINDILPIDQEKKLLKLENLKVYINKYVIGKLSNKKYSKIASKVRKFLKFLNYKIKLTVSDISVPYKDRFLNVNSTKYLSYVYPAFDPYDAKELRSFYIQTGSRANNVQAAAQYQIVGEAFDNIYEKYYLFVIINLIVLAVVIYFFAYKFWLYMVFIFGAFLLVAVTSIIQLFLGLKIGLFSAILIPYLFGVFVFGVLICWSIYLSLCQGKKRMREAMFLVFSGFLILIIIFSSPFFAFLTVGNASQVDLGLIAPIFICLILGFSLLLSALVFQIKDSNFRQYIRGILWIKK